MQPGALVDDWLRASRGKLNTPVITTMSVEELTVNRLILLSTVSSWLKYEVQ
jgi:hypothetical protein